jgi:hypothetical protein
MKILRREKNKKRKWLVDVEVGEVFFLEEAPCEFLIKVSDKIPQKINTFNLTTNQLEACDLEVYCTVLDAELVLEDR